MTYLARTPETRRTVGQLAGFLQGSESHLSKVMQRLQRAGLVRSTRGPKGGYRLERPAQEITLLAVYEVVEGPLDEADCLFDRPACGTETCILGDLLERVNRQINEYLSQTVLSDLSEVYGKADACVKCERHAGRS
jgi:Rrf2 family protein